LFFFFFLFKADYRGVLEQSAGLCFFFKSDDQHAGLEHYCRRDILKCSGAIRGNICPASKHSDVVYLLYRICPQIVYSVFGSIIAVATVSQRHHGKGCRKAYRAGC
jgi:hypothetical protein